MTRHPTIRTAVAAVVALAATACGGDDGASSFTFSSTPDTVATTLEATTTVATTTTVARTTPRPATDEAWTPAVGNLAGTPSECGNMSMVYAHPERDLLIAGVALEGLWASTDGGASWTQLGQGDGSAAIVNRPTSILYDPERPATFWESGIYNGGGAYRTDDDGQTFVALGDATHVDRISVDLTDPNRATILINRHEAPMLSRSTDGGQTWSDATGNLPEGFGAAVAPHVVDAQLHLAGTRDGTASGIYRSTDGGATWTLVVSGAVSGPPVVLRDSGDLLWPLHDGSLVHSADRGATWEEVAPAGSVSGSVIELPDGSLATYTDRLRVSTDGGTRWTGLGPALPYSPVGMVYLPARSTFYIWRFDCIADAPNPVPADAIMRLGLTSVDD